MPLADFCEWIYSNNLTWAPDGDEAFDDGSYVLQFDVENRVRLIAFTLGKGSYHDPAILSDLWLEADVFYGLLQKRHDEFVAEWMDAPKDDANDHESAL